MEIRDGSSRRPPREGFLELAKTCAHIKRTARKLLPVVVGGERVQIRIETKGGSIDQRLLELHF